MGYDWGPHRDTCYQLYAVEKRSVDEVADYMKRNHRFTPSKRSFQEQFRKWNFPPRKTSIYQDPQLAARTKELWETNTPQTEILRILKEEGYEIGARGLTRLRNRNRWMLRAPPQSPKTAVPFTSSSGDDGVLCGTAAELSDTKGEFIGDGRQVGHGQVDEGDEGEESAEVIEEESEEEGEEGENAIMDRRHDVFLAQIQGFPTKHQYPASFGTEMDMQSTQSQPSPTDLFQGVVRQWSDVASEGQTTTGSQLVEGSPDSSSLSKTRYPSDMTIQESKRILNLDRILYSEIRHCFQQICDEFGVTRKAETPPVQWESFKDRLVQQIPGLQETMAGGTDVLDKKKQALDVICTDVARRSRKGEEMMSIAASNNILGLNPNQSREVRAVFYNVLVENNFTVKTNSGQGHWDELKKQWLDKSGLLGPLVSDGDENDVELKARQKAIEVLARDVSKRLRDHQTGRNPRRIKASQRLPLPPPSSSAELVESPTSPERMEMRRPSTPPGPLTPMSPLTPMKMDLPAAAAAPVAVADVNMYNMPFSEIAVGTPLITTPESHHHHHPMPLHIANPLLQAQQQQQQQQQPINPSAAAAAPPPLIPPSLSVAAAAVVAQGRSPTQHRPAGNPAVALIPTAAAVLSLEQAIDPSLLLAPQTPDDYMTEPPEFLPPQFAVPLAPAPAALPPMILAPLAIYFRAHPGTTYPHDAGLWIATLRSASLKELRLVAARNFPGGVCTLVQGVLKEVDGTEMAIPVQDDEQVVAYLEAQFARQLPCIFEVRIAWDGDQVAG